MDSVKNPIYTDDNAVVFSVLTTPLDDPTPELSMFNLGTPKLFSLVHRNCIRSGKNRRPQVQTLVGCTGKETFVLLDYRYPFSQLHR